MTELGEGGGSSVAVDDRASAIIGVVARGTESTVDGVRIVVRRIAPVTSSVTALGWTVLGAGLFAWVIGDRLGWIELRVVAFACLFLFALCSLLTIGRTLLRIEIDLDPHRVVVGDPAAGRVSITNISRVRLLPIALELPVGASAARFSLPSLPSEGSHEELFIVPTLRRAVIPVGPAMTVRGDPLGLLRRSVSWTGVTDLYVHPVTVPLEPLGSGLLRDLEGQTSNDISMSDLAFHALRDYAPGDDRRHIHWRSSAKVGSSVPGGKFLVRQFLDTRRSHLTIAVDGKPSAYGDADDFETAISAAASVAVQAIRDEMETTVVVAEQAAHEAGGQLTLDRFSLATFGLGGSLSSLAAQGALLAPDTSLALLITGANTSFSELQRSAAHFPPEVKTVAMRIDPSRPVGISGTPSLTILNLPHLGDLAALLRGGGLQ
jgi:uncharacterized protein (DUF58 family)